MGRVRYCLSRCLGADCFRVKVGSSRSVIAHVCADLVHTVACGFAATSRWRVTEETIGATKERMMREMGDMLGTLGDGADRAAA